MLVPPPAQMGAASDLQPCSAAGPEQSQACPASPIPFPFPLGFEGIDGEGCSSLSPPKLLRSAMTVQRLNQIQVHGIGGGRQVVEMSRMASSLEKAAERSGSQPSLPQLALLLAACASSLLPRHTCGHRHALAANLSFVRTASRLQSWGSIGPF